MKCKYHVGMIYREHITAECMVDLVRICPEGEIRGDFKYTGNEDEIKVKQVLKRLELEGLQPGRIGSLELGRYRLRIECVYSIKDLEQSDLLEFEPKKVVRSVAKRGESGVYEVEDYLLKSNLDIFAIDMEVYCVTEQVRQKIEQDDLKHITFEPIRVIGKKAESWQGKVWMLSSDFQLPKLAPSCRLVYLGKGEPFDGDYTRMIGIDDGVYTPAEFHYRSSDIKALEAFDLAFTFEKFGWEKSLVASRRFYECCRKNGYRLNWWPVRIDPD